MTLVKTFTLTCDDCGQNSNGYPKEAFLAKCRKWGWYTYDNGSGEQHRCPDCRNIRGPIKKEAVK
jgi:hypothetical protein